MNLIELVVFCQLMMSMMTLMVCFISTIYWNKEYFYEKLQNTIQHYHDKWLNGCTEKQLVKVIEKCSEKVFIPTYYTRNMFDREFTDEEWNDFCNNTSGSHNTMVDEVESVVNEYSEYYAMNDNSFEEQFIEEYLTDTPQEDDITSSDGPKTLKIKKTLHNNTSLSSSESSSPSSSESSSESGSPISSSQSEDKSISTNTSTKYKDHNLRTMTDAINSVLR